jgi:hypothetical protein
MNSTPSSKPRTFLTPALTLMWEEAQLASAGGYDGVGFEGRKNDIWIYYTHGVSTYMGQDQTYPAPVWRDLDLAMCLIERLARRIQCPIRTSFSNQWTSRWTLHVPRRDEKALSVLSVILGRIDQTLIFLDSPLDPPSDVS